MAASLQLLAVVVLPSLAIMAISGTGGTATLSFPVQVVNQGTTDANLSVSVCPRAITPCSISVFSSLDWDQYACNNVETFAHAFSLSDFSSLRELIDSTTLDASQSDTGDAALSPVDVSSRVQEVFWSDDSTVEGGFEHGPCELWLGDLMVLQADNCAVAFPTAPAACAMDYSSCSGCCQLRFYALALTGTTWCAYKRVVQIQNGPESKSSSCTITGANITSSSSRCNESAVPEPITSSSKSCSSTSNSSNGSDETNFTFAPMGSAEQTVPIECPCRPSFFSSLDTNWGDGSTQPGSDVDDNGFSIEDSSQQLTRYPVDESNIQMLAELLLPATLLEYLLWKVVAHHWDLRWTVAEMDKLADSLPRASYLRGTTQMQPSLSCINRRTVDCTRVNCMKTTQASHRSIAEDGDTTDHSHKQATTIFDIEDTLHVSLKKETKE